MMNETSKAFEGWCVLELLGRRRLGGLVTEVVIAGTGLLRIDIPTPDGTMQTQMYGAQAVYCLTPTTEEIARAVAARNQPEPVHRYELPAPALTPTQAPIARDVEADEIAARSESWKDRDDDEYDYRSEVDYADL